MNNSGCSVFVPHLVCLSALCLLPISCRQVVQQVMPWELAPEVVEEARKPGSWYAYLPQYAPGFCLITRHAILWKDPRLPLGYWRAVHPQAPQRVLMEARGDMLLLHRRFIWDGMTVGRTLPEDLLPTLQHDALYYALQGGAPISRRQVDLAFLRAQREHRSIGAYTSYAGIRLLGGLYNNPPNANPPRIERTTPGEPPAALEPDRPEPLERRISGGLR